MIKKFMIGTVVAVMLGTGLIAATPRFPDTSTALVVEYSGPVDRLMYESILKQTEGKSNVKQLVFKLTTHGGYVHYQQKILEHLKSITTNLIVEVPDYALSAGAIIVIHADKVIVSKNAIIMLHTPRLDSTKDTVTIDPDFSYEDYVRHRETTKLTKILKGDLLTKYLSGKDIFLTGTELSARMQDPSSVKVVDDKDTIQDHFKKISDEYPNNLVQ